MWRPVEKDDGWVEKPLGHSDYAIVWGAPVKVVLTIAHLNQDPSDNRKENLRALCQRCHNVLDLPWRMKNAAMTNAARRADESDGQMLLASGEGESSALPLDGVEIDPDAAESGERHLAQGITYGGAWSI